jgi:hypothetical protein
MHKQTKRQVAQPVTRLIAHPEGPPTRFILDQYFQINSDAYYERKK